MSGKDLRRDYNRAEFDGFAKAIGRATLAWNDLHVSIGSIFWALTKIPNGIVPGAIWHSLKSDRAQRDMTLELAMLDAMGHDIKDDLRNDIKWLLDRTTSLEDMRNNIIHSPFIFYNGEITSFHLCQHKRALKLHGRDLSAYCEYFYESVTILRDYAERLEKTIRGLEKAAAPRPQLPTQHLRGSSAKGGA